MAPFNNCNTFKQTMKQQIIIQTEEDKLKWRLSLSHKQRYFNAIRLIQLIHKLKKATKQ